MDSSSSSSTGSINVDWTVNGTKDADQCGEVAAAAIEITVTDSRGSSAGVYQQSCTAFGRNITLNEGYYTAGATLIDAGGAPRTAFAQLHPFTIRGNDEIRTSIDFSARLLY